MDCPVRKSQTNTEPKTDFSHHKKQKTKQNKKKVNVKNYQNCKTKHLKVPLLKLWLYNQIVCKYGMHIHDYMYKLAPVLLKYM